MQGRPWRCRVASLRIALSVAVALAAGVPTAGQGAPGSVTVAGSFQSEAGCPGDWQPDCALTHLAYDAGDDVWQAVFALPSGSYEYKAAIDDSWTVSYGATPLAARTSHSLSAPPRS